MNKTGKIRTLRTLSAAELSDSLEAVESDVSAVIIILDDHFKPTGADSGYMEALGEKIRGFGVPVIAALSADAVGGIGSAVEAAHLCVASEGLRLDMGQGSFTSDEALRSGLINSVVGEDRVAAEAVELAGTISHLAPLSIRAFLEAVEVGLGSDLEKGFEAESEFFCRLFSSADLREGLRAFFEKRAPNFTGE